MTLAFSYFHIITIFPAVPNVMQPNFLLRISCFIIFYTYKSVCFVYATFYIPIYKMLDKMPKLNNDILLLNVIYHIFFLLDSCTNDNIIVGVVVWFYV